MMRFFAVLTVVADLVGLACLAGASKGPAAAAPLQEQKAQFKEPQSRVDILAMLDESLDMKKFQQPNLTLEQFFEMVAEVLKAQKQFHLPIIVNAAAFKEENPDAPDVYRTEVKFAPYPPRMKVGKALALALSQVPTNNATFRVLRDHLEITTGDRASIERKLHERVLARFDKKTLAEALEELAEMTGTTILLDERVGERRLTKISAHFNNDVSLQGVLRTLSEMAGMKVILVDTVLFVTTPEHAEALGKQYNRDIQHRLFLDLLNNRDVPDQGVAGQLGSLLPTPPLGPPAPNSGGSNLRRWRESAPLLDRMPLPPYIPNYPDPRRRVEAGVE